MIRELLRFHVPVRYVVWLLSLTAVLGGTVAAGLSRERAALPEAAEQLRLARADAGSFFSCFQGVNDELATSGEAGTWTRSSILNARERLTTCDLDTVRSRVAALDLPPQASITEEPLRRGRMAIEKAQGWFDRMILEAEGTVAVLDRELRTGQGGAAIPLGTRAVEAAFRQASLWAGRAEAALDD